MLKTYWILRNVYVAQNEKDEEAIRNVVIATTEALDAKC